MHMRKKKWARPELEVCPYFHDFPENCRNHWSEVFPVRQRLEMELGCGKGVSTARMAHENPSVNYLALDLSADVLGDARRNLAAAYGQDPIDNIHLVKCDIEYISRFIGPEDPIARIWISFCNPWTRNRRHEKRRLTHPRQLMQYRDFLLPGGEIYFKTDDDTLFDDSLVYFEASGFSCQYLTRDLHASGFTPNYITEHEKRFVAEGIPIKFGIFRKEETVADFDPVHWLPPQFSAKPSAPCPEGGSAHV